MTACLPGHKYGSLGDFTEVQVFPQCHKEFARKRHNAHPSHALCPAAIPVLEPLTQLALGLVQEPPPRRFDHECPYSAVAGFADALFPTTVTTIVRRSAQSGQRADLSAIPERPPRKELVRQQTRTACPKAFEIVKFSRYVTTGLCSLHDGCLALRLDRFELRIQQRNPGPFSLQFSQTVLRQGTPGPIA